ncbi:MAG: SUMF1/EgtB/PvdO family nonheme iron enzyme [Methylobacter sp.]
MSRLISNNLRDEQDRACSIWHRPIKLVPLAAALLLVCMEVHAVPPHDPSYDNEQQLQAAEKNNQHLEEEKQRLEQQQAEAKRQAEQTIKENAELRKKIEAAERELTLPRTKNAPPKTNPVVEQRARKLEKENAAMQRKVDEAAVEKHRLKELLAEEKRKTGQADTERQRLEAKLEQSRAKYIDPSEPVYPGGVIPSSGIETNTAASSAVGSTIKDCDVCPELVVIPSGEFMMGSQDGEKLRRLRSNAPQEQLTLQVQINLADFEAPQHKVRIGYTLAVGKYEVTFAQWDACVAEGGCIHKPADEGWGRGTMPVFNVSWDDIKQQYLPWLNRKAYLDSRPVNQQYRLLTEAEWEYAARADTTTDYSFGDRDTLTYDRANTVRHPLPMDSSAPNPWGLYNIHGNVQEVVEDCFVNNYINAPTDGSAVKEKTCSSYVLRSGAWMHSRLARSAERDATTPADYRSNTVGFRLVRTLP